MNNSFNTETDLNHEQHIHYRYVSIPAGIFEQKFVAILHYRRTMMDQDFSYWAKRPDDDGWDTEDDEEELDDILDPAFTLPGFGTKSRGGSQRRFRK